MIELSPLKCEGSSIPVPLQLERYNGKGIFKTPHSMNQSTSCKEKVVSPMIMHRVDSRNGDIEMFSIGCYCSKECYALSKLNRYPVIRNIWDKKTGELKPELFVESLIQSQNMNGFGVWFRAENENHMDFLIKEVQRMQGSPMHGLGNWPEGALADSMHDEYRTKINNILDAINTHLEE